MTQTLTEIAQALIDTDKKVQLIYAFNGTGKTRLSCEFKELIAPKNMGDAGDAEEGQGIQVLYYNAFTEDLFYWDNDLDTDVNRKLLIRPNSFTNLVLQVLREQGLEGNIISNFQHFASNRLTPRFNEDYTEITFSIERGNDEQIENIKISKGEESNLIWCVFYSLLEQVVEVLNIPELENRPKYKFNDLQFVFIDDPVSSLDENHLIELAVNLVELIKKSVNLKFIISTHSPLFYNVLYSELGVKEGNILRKEEDGTFELAPKKGNSNNSFSYHLFLKRTIEEAIMSNTIQKYHFTLLRNLYEKTASFLGYQRWSELLPDDKQTYYNRIIQFTSHSTLSDEVVAEPTVAEKKIVEFLLKYLIENKYYNEKIKEQNVAI
ncbi:ATP-binding protein [Arachidicoccus terrestris]|uniref:hypothetical protein n=1 Tax=Arachidicoccus terrestris TaxID=2875539 RepID=UPI001CC70428|nr:hypothetical protein [Arachidicoccus terrestris]UAY56650.1 hypothetical protein K9M52_06530 [Arachidicoccus terrestris]